MTRDGARDDAPILEGRDLAVAFDVGRRSLRAVDGVSLQVPRGATVGLVGESGSGKSTLGLTLIRRYEPDRGTVLFDGTDITTWSERRLRPIRRRMQMVFQDPFASLDPAMRVGEIVAEPLRVHRVGSRDEIRARVAELLTAVGLSPDITRRRPTQFSGGQRQRIAIARALALDPDVLVADEPVSALDVSVQAQIVALLDEIRERMGLTTLLIAHDLGLVHQVSDRIAVMYLGRIVEEGPTDDVVFSPQHPYTASLLAATPLPDPELERGRARLVLRGEPPSPLTPPPGCRFHPRCPIARPRCRHDDPPLLRVRAGVSAACHYAGEVPRPLTPPAGHRSRTQPEESR